MVVLYINREKMTNDELIGISKRLDAILSVLMEQTQIQEQNNREKISWLNDLGFNYHEIAKILHTSTSSVAKELSIMKKRAKNG